MYLQDNRCFVVDNFFKPLNKLLRQEQYPRPPVCDAWPPNPEAKDNYTIEKM
jgi:hypothetical protein